VSEQRAHGAFRDRFFRVFSADIFGKLAQYGLCCVLSFPVGNDEIRRRHQIVSGDVR
jgi:hypothetical protein